MEMIQKFLDQQKKANGTIWTLRNYIGIELQIQKFLDQQKKANGTIWTLRNYIGIELQIQKFMDQIWEQGGSIALRDLYNKFSESVNSTTQNR